jgi:peptide/nickel transport system substrate-binding protein
MKKGLFLLVAILLISAFIMAGCNSTPTTTAAPPVKTSAPAQTSAAPATSAASKTTAAPSADQPQYGGKLTWIRNMGIPDVGAPADTPSGTFVLSLVSPVLESVVGKDANGNFKPSLVESVEYSPDGKVITMHLLKGINFQDGTPFNAASIKYNLEACLAANCASSSMLKLVSSYQIVDDYTLKVNLSKYDARFMLTLAETANGQIASPTAMAKATNPQDRGKDHVVGTGPFKFDSWQQDQYIRMVKWDGYRVKGRPYVDAIEIRNNSDLTVSIMSFKAGEVQMVENIDPSQYVSLKKEGYHVDIPPLGFVFTVIPDSANPDSPFKDIRVRQALEYAIDKVSMTQGIGLGTQFPSYQFATSPPVGQDPWYIPDLAKREYNPAKAKELLAAAGYPNGFSYPLLSDVRARQDQVVAIQTYLKAVGINTTLDMADVMRASTFGKDGFKGILVPGFPYFSSFTQWLAVFNDPVFTYPTVYFPQGFKQAWADVAGEIDGNKRIEKMKALMKQAVDETIQVPYLQDGPRYVDDGTIVDMKWDVPGVTGGYDAANVWLKKKK